MSSRPPERRGGLLGIGLDGRDGHRRITRGDDFVLFGGSRKTHEKMQDVVLRMSERLKERGKGFGDLSKKEFDDLARESL